MKKVLALVLAVMMVSTVAFAAAKRATISPAGTIKFDDEGIVLNGKGGAGITELNVGGTSTGAPTILYQDNGSGALLNTETGELAIKDSGESAKAAEEAQAEAGKAGLGRYTYIKSLGDMIFRSVTNENYTVTSLKVATGKAYVAGVTISDADEQVKVSFVKDLGNVTPKDFDVAFTLKGKGKMIIRTPLELAKYKEFTGNTTKKVKETATIPSVKFQMYGSVCYGKVTVDLGTYSDEDLDGLQDRAVDKNYIGTAGSDKIDLGDDIIKFTYGGNFAYVTRNSAGAYVADAILTEEYDEGLTLEARVYSGDTLYLDCDNEPDDIVSLLDTGDGDVDFYFFHTDTKYTTLNTNARLIFNETEEGDHVYSYKNGKLTEVGEYDEDEGCIVVRARTLGQYITSDVALDWLEIATSDDVENPDTGANDVVGIAAALAAVALVSAAAVSLKK